MPRLRSSSFGALAALLSLGVLAGPALAVDPSATTPLPTTPVDKTPPVLTAQATGLLKGTSFGRLSNSYFSGKIDGATGPGQYSILAPTLLASSSEAGTLTYVGRDLTGRAIGRYEVDVAAGQQWNSDDSANGISALNQMFPSTVISCYGGPVVSCGERLRLNPLGVYSMEVFATDAAGNRSTKTLKVYAIFLGTLSFPFSI